jgi:hypothetical protein
VVVKSQNPLKSGQFSFLFLLGTVTAAAFYVWAWGLGETARGIIGVVVGLGAFAAIWFVILRELCR